MSDDRILAVLIDIRNWTLPDDKSRAAYQMMGDATPSMEQVRIACKIGRGTLFALADRWTAMGLMELKDDKRRVRLFDLTDFGLLDTGPQRESPADR